MWLLYIVAGDVAVFSTLSLAAVARTRAAHMVFTTALAFNQAETALLSVSADASGRITLLAKPAPAGRLSLASLLLLRAALLLVGVVAMAWFLGLRERAAALLGRLGVGPGRNSEL